MADFATLAEDSPSSRHVWDAGKEHRPIEVIKLNGPRDARAEAAVPVQAAVDLAAYGYCLSDCQAALQQCSSDPTAALKLLFSTLAGQYYTP